MPRGLPLMTSLHMSETRNSYAYYVSRQEARLVSLSLKPVCFHCTKLSWNGRVWKQKNHFKLISENLLEIDTKCKSGGITAFD